MRDRWFLFHAVCFATTLTHRQESSARHGKGPRESSCSDGKGAVKFVGGNQASNFFFFLAVQMYETKARLRAVSSKLTTLKSTSAMTDAMRGAAKVSTDGNEF